MSTYNNKYDILGSTIKPNPASVKYWADLSSNPNGGDLKYFNGTKWVLVNNKDTEDISQIKQQIADLEQNKEDKVEGKGLSTNDYTTPEKNKLAAIEAEANKYVLPAATASALGGVKIGSNITLANGGTISITKANVTSALGVDPTTKYVTLDTAQTITG